MVIISPCRNVYVMELRPAWHYAQSINNRDEQKNFRVSHLYSISNLYSISKWRAAAACSLCQRLDTVRTSPLIHPLYVPPEDSAAKSAESLQRKLRRAFSDAICIKDPMFTRTWSSETTATHNARNNGEGTSISSAHPRTLVTPTIHREYGVLCKWYKRTRSYEGEINLLGEKPMLSSLIAQTEFWYFRIQILELDLPS